MKITNAQTYRQEMITLLSGENLPTEDLPENPDNFFVAMEKGEVIGTIGLQVYGDYGLLRSLVVDPGFRGLGVADKLLNKMDDVAMASGLKSVYLLTETAPAYFTRKGFEQVSRAEIPVEVQGASEFSHVCPQSAIAMKKIIK